MATTTPFQTKTKIIGPLTKIDDQWIRRGDNYAHLCDSELRKHVYLPRNVTRIWLHLTTKPTPGAFRAVPRGRSSSGDGCYRRLRFDGEEVSRKMHITTLLHEALEDLRTHTNGYIYGWIEYNP